MVHILVIDDEEQILNILSRSLSKAGYTVSIAHNGDAGMEICKETEVDLVITDIVMPEKEGLETITEMKQTYTDLKIIAMSGGGRIGPTNYLEIAKSLGAEKTLTKPFRRKELLETVKEVLGEKALESVEEE